MDGMVNYGILQPGIGNALAAGYQQAQDRQNALMQQQQQAEMNKMRLESGRMDLDRLQQERQTMLDFQSQLKSMGKDPDLGKMFDVMVRSGIPEQVRLGLEGKQKLTEQQRFAKIMGYEERTPTAPAASPAPSAAPATNARTTPAAVPAAPNTTVNPVAAQFGPEQVAAVTNRIQGLLQLGTPQALQAARVLQDQLEMASRQKPPTQYMAVGNNIFNAETGQFVKNPYATSGGAGTGGATAVSKEDLTPEQKQALNTAISSGRLDPYRITGKNIKHLANALIADPNANLNVLAGQARLATNATFQQKVMTAEALPEIMTNMVNAGKKLNYSDAKFLGALEQYKQGQFNDPDLVSYMTQRNDALMSIANVMRGVGMTDQAHRAEVEVSSPTMSPKALDAWLAAQKTALEPRLKRMSPLSVTGGEAGAQGAYTRKPAQAAPAVSADEKAQALSWAKANRSDPRAAKILQMYGEK